MAEKLERYGVKILGTSFDALDLAEDRGSFQSFWNPMIFHSQNMVLSKVLNRPWSFLMIWDSPLVRPSYVLGGQKMKIVINKEELEHHVVDILNEMGNNQILLDHF